MTIQPAILKVIRLDRRASLDRRLNPVLGLVCLRTMRVPFFAHVRQAVDARDQALMRLQHVHVVVGLAYLRHELGEGNAISSQWPVASSQGLVVRD
ncbi:MAG: hypothetical protein A2Y63_06640 [Candidatus Riflebacteria bacterium RBG_13_59_9]|nr:MAG: hypothetical protein A2Y63_06640 [Candidatus Riflebacteria bacterium RBG_13_59_9]